nr:hypothetical protein [Tanacetum cinerariifolium]
HRFEDEGLQGIGYGVVRDCRELVSVLAGKVGMDEQYVQTRDRGDRFGALAVVRNGLPKMKGFFSFSLISKITKSTGYFVGKLHESRVGHDVHIGPLIEEGVHVLKAPYAARYFEIPSDVLLLCYLLLEDHFINRPSSVSSVLSLLSSSPLARDRIYVPGDGEFGLFRYQYFLRGSASSEFLEKSEHFSDSVVDLFALLENGILKSFRSFALMVIKSEVLNDFPRFVGILIADFSSGSVVNLALKMKGDMIIKDLDLKPTIDAMMRDFL